MKTFGKEMYNSGYAIQRTSDGGFIIAGFTGNWSLYEGDIYLMKIDDQGILVWDRSYDEYTARSVQQTPDGGYIVVGRTYGDIYLMKTNPNGDILWTKTYGGDNDDEGYSVLTTIDGGYIIVGYTRPFGAGNNDIYLIKTNASGDTLWTKTYGNEKRDCGYSVQQTLDGGYIITGVSNWYELCLIKTDAQGDALWTKTYGGDSQQQNEGHSVQQTLDGGYIIAGLTKSYGAGDDDMYLVKTDSNGALLWEKTFGGDREDVGYSVQQTSDGGYIVAGYTGSFGKGLYSVYVVKTDLEGDTVWTKTYGGTGQDYGYSIQETSDGDYVVVGRTGTYGEFVYDVYLIKIKP